MPVYLGSLGRMIKLPYVGSQQLQSEERYNFSSTLEGKRKAQVKPQGTRTWALTADHFRPNEHSLLSQFADGVWGPGPFVFVSADAPVTNILTPEVASSSPRALPGSVEVTMGGPMQTEDFLAPRSWMNGNPSILISLGDEYCPVLPGKPVTASAYLNGPNPRVSLYFYDASGGILSSHMSPSGSGSYVGKRFSVTERAPIGAASCRVRALGVDRSFGPAVTWSDSLLAFGAGQGCLQAVVHGVSRDQVLAVAGHTYSNVSFTVSEVG